MTFVVCTCLYKSVIETPVSLWSTIVEFLFSVIIVVCGETMNYRFVKKLVEEKRNVPLGRKGNVIEPIMSLYCKIEMIYWPYHLLYFWINKNEIIPVEYMNGWWCPIATYGMRFGRVCIAYRSIFVALIRYIYIVHQKKSNLWKFSKVSRNFRIASIAIPVIMETIGTFTNSYEYVPTFNGFKECIAFYTGSNTTDNIQIPTQYPLVWTLQVIPESMVLVVHYIYLSIAVVVYLNLSEGFLYFQIYRCVKRYICNFINKTIIIYWFVKIISAQDAH